jgi:hypothetical protein
MDNEELLIVVTTLILFIEILQHVWERPKSSVPILYNFNVVTPSYKCNFAQIPTSFNLVTMGSKHVTGETMEYNWVFNVFTNRI